MIRKLKSKSVVLTKGNKALEIRERTVPLPEPGCITIAVVRAGICGTDPHLWLGHMPVTQDVVLGHEGLGRITELGDGVATDHAGQKIAIGDIVFWNPIRPCMRCYDCTVTKDLTGCKDGTFWSPADQGMVWASYTEFATLVPNNAFYKVDTSVPLDAYIAMGCALPTMCQAIDNLGPIEPCWNVVVQGAGPVGLAAVMLASIAGCSNIACIEGNSKRLERAKEFGATLLLNMEEHKTKDDRANYIKSAFGVGGVDLVIECSGNVNAFDEGIDLLARNGRYLLVGTWAGRSKVTVSPFHIVQNALKIIGTTYASPASYYKAIKLVTTHWQAFPLVECITHRYRLEDVEEAFETVLAGEATKACIYPEGYL
ncbi:hypothetical protein N7536_000184 [Penicillium majusculum]|nr:hypothetical protein N7536_000184 [Penicillium majusculum]